jgi:hypothetical protein
MGRLARLNVEYPSLRRSLFLPMPVDIAKSGREERKALRKRERR